MRNMISWLEKNHLVAHILKRLHKKELQRQKTEVISPANSVGKVSFKKETLKSTWEFTLEKSLTLANSVERVSLKKQTLKSTWDFILERTLTHALNVKGVLIINNTSLTTWEFTPERGLTPANCVESASFEKQTLNSTWKFIVERNLLYVSMSLEFYTQTWPQCPHKNSYWRETSHLPTMWKEFL